MIHKIFLVVFWAIFGDISKRESESLLIFTLPETNSEPLKIGTPQKETHLPTIDLRGPCGGYPYKQVGDIFASDPNSKF